MSTTNTTIKIMRDIAACYERAADALDDAARLASMLATDHDRADVPEPTAGCPFEMLADALDRAHADAVAVLGWDPDTLSTRNVSDNIHALRTLDDLDRVEALEKRRAEMRPAKKVRGSVLDAITARRDVLAARAREAAL